MWVLESKNENKAMYFTSNKRNYTVGRSPDPAVCDFSIIDDASISRKHATISLSEENLVLTDLGSKYGTFINQLDEEKAGIEPNTAITLKINDNIRFGALNNIWTVNKLSFVTCTSTLKGDHMQQLKVFLDTIEATLKNDWDDTCQYLTMPAITLTIKVVLALVQGAYIVTIGFWKKCCEAIVNLAKLPDPKDFLPDVVESTLNKEFVSFFPDAKRRKIFDGKKIVFMSKRQMEMYRKVLTTGSGTPILLGESKMTKSMLCAPDVIVIQYILNNTTQESQPLQNQINGIVNYLKSKGKRVIADPEIGLAILYCSLEKYCNPDFNFTTEVMKETTSDSVKKIANILAQETQESINSSSNKQVMVDDSLVSIKTETTEEAMALKRKLNSENGDATESVNKKMATEENVGLNESQEFFNFVDKDMTTNNNSDASNLHRLNLSKPLKRKSDYSMDDDDNMFNFISLKDKRQKTHSTSDLVNGSNEKQSESYTDKIKSESDSLEFNKNHETVDIKNSLSFKCFTELKGVSVTELLKLNLSWKSRDVVDNIIKKEDITDDLEDKISALDLGATIVTIKDNLVVPNKFSLPAEPHQSHAKNFKIFKKVWPVKVQMAMVQ